MRNSDHRFWIEPSIFQYAILDRSTGRVHLPKMIFHSQIHELHDRLGLWPSEVVQIIEEVGHATCVAVLQHYYAVSGRPYDAKHDIDKWVKYDEAQKRQGRG
jgi:hypothetical protein